MSDRDTIERAIRHIDSCLDVDPWARDIAIDAMQRLLEQASCRQVTGKLDDTISRHAAIDALLEAYPDNMDVEFILGKLPSAQPEIIRCKDCNHVERARSEEVARKFGQIYICGRHVFLNPNPDDYCSLAERKTDG